MITLKAASEGGDIDLALGVDLELIGSRRRADYITGVAAKGGLMLAELDSLARGFACLDHNYFFERPFLALLVVSRSARRCGLGFALLAHHTERHAELWTSTNRSNTPMQKLLDKAGWQYHGELTGLDVGDPERFYSYATRI